jgi:hypothetical protein
MPATALYNVAMSPADAFGYTRDALQAAGAALGAQSPPAHIAFSLTHRAFETGSLEAVMPGRALIAEAPDGKATVTLSIDPATQFILYAAGIGLVALLFGGLLFGSMENLWFLIVLGGEAWLFWCVFSKWPSDVLAILDARMRSSNSVSAAVPPPAAPVFTPGAPAPPSANAADIAEQIRHLAELRDQGHITQEEFDAKKAELLKRI